MSSAGALRPNSTQWEGRHETFCSPRSKSACKRVHVQAEAKSTHAVWSMESGCPANSARITDEVGAKVTDGVIRV